MRTGQSEQGSSTGGTLYAAWGDKVGQKKIGVLTKAKQSRSIYVRCAAMAANFAKLPELLCGKQRGASA